MYHFFTLDAQTFFESQLYGRVSAVNELCFIKNHNLLKFHHFKNRCHKGLGRFLYALSSTPTPVGGSAAI